MAKIERANKVNQIAKMMYDHKWDTLTAEEQKLFDLVPADLPSIFISLDRIRNEVRNFLE